MNFSFKSYNASARLGIIKSMPRLPDFEMETPNVLFYTKRGTVPHLTYDVIQMMTTQSLGLHIPVSHITNIQNRIKFSNSNIAQFIGMNEYLTYCSIINPAEKRKEGYHEKDKISVWTKFGRKCYSAIEYMELIEDLKPDMFLMLADGDTHIKSFKKRNIKSFHNTAQFFDKCVEFYENSEILKHSRMLAAVEGGFDLNLREECSKLVGGGPIFGVVIDGLHDCSYSTVEMKFSDIKQVIEASLKFIPNDKLRIMHGCWNPTTILDLIDFGIDLFDSSYPYLITEQAGALIFPNDADSLIHNNINQINGVNGLGNSVLDNEDHIQSSEKQSDFEKNPPLKKIKLSDVPKYHISMLDPSFACDFSPIIKNCTCLTCKNHTRAYIHHLMNVKELLGLTLLMIHNMHHYLKFLSAIRKSLSDNTFSQLKKNFHTWALRTEEKPFS